MYEGDKEVWCRQFYKRTQKEKKKPPGRPCLHWEGCIKRDKVDFHSITD